MHWMRRPPAAVSVADGPSRYRGSMQNSPADSPADLPADVPTDPSNTGSTGAPTSAERLINAVQRLNDVDVVASSADDRAAVLELIGLADDEQRTTLLVALLLERIRER